MPKKNKRCQQIQQKVQRSQKVTLYSSGPDFSRRTSSPSDSSQCVPQDDTEVNHLGIDPVQVMHSSTANEPLPEVGLLDEHFHASAWQSNPVGNEPVQDDLFEDLFVDRNMFTITRASYSQRDNKYRRSKNKQCTANAFTFLAYLYEDENITWGDLDEVLDKGDELYNRIHCNYRYLKLEDLPSRIQVRQSELMVNKHDILDGTLQENRDPGLAQYLDLDAQLTWLYNEVKYALLVMATNTIALFRTENGKFGYFDPHSRTPDQGLPIRYVDGDPDRGFAVMLTFDTLYHMSEQIRKVFREIGVKNAQFNFMPLEFVRFNPVISNEAPSKTVNECLSQTAVESTMPSEIPSGSGVTVNTQATTKKRQQKNINTDHCAAPQIPSGSGVRPTVNTQTTTKKRQRKTKNINTDHSEMETGQSHIDPVTLHVPTDQIVFDHCDGVNFNVGICCHDFPQTHSNLPPTKEKNKKRKTVTQNDSCPLPNTETNKRKKRKGVLSQSDVSKPTACVERENTNLNSITSHGRHAQSEFGHLDAVNTDKVSDCHDFVQTNTGKSRKRKHPVTSHNTLPSGSDVTGPARTNDESETSSTTSAGPSNLFSPLRNTASDDISLYLSKLNKQQRRKFQRRLLRSNMVSQNKSDKERKKYTSNEIYREKKKTYSRRQYVDENVKQSKINKIKKRYKESAVFRQKMKQNNAERWKDKDVRERHRQCTKDRYDKNQQFREKHTNTMKLNIRKKYRDQVFREKHKGTMRQFMKNNYTDSVFRAKHKIYMNKRYTTDPTFREKRKIYMNEKYATDPLFRSSHRHLMALRMKHRYERDLLFRRTKHCAAKIINKYRHMNRPTHEEIEEINDPLMAKAISIFRKQIRSGPSYACTTCHRAMFEPQVRECIRSDYTKKPALVAACLTGKYVHVCDDDCSFETPCNVPEERKTEWICTTCHDYVVGGKMPKGAVANGLALADIPAELKDLNILERHLVSKMIAFAKILVLPKGRQRAIRGNVVCVPSEVQETVDALPRLRSQSQVMSVKLKRNLNFRGHQLFQTVTWSKLVQALHKLKEIHPQYEDIAIRDDPESCDPTLLDLNDEVDEFDDEDFNAEEIMEIDRMEHDAMSEADGPSDTDSENDDNLTNDVQIAQEQSDSGQEGDMPNGGLAIESCIQPRNIRDEILAFGDGIYSVAPAQRNSPVSFFKTPKLEAMAFPVQFPTGQNTLDDRRQYRLTPLSYFKFRLLNVDDRFARDQLFIFCSISE